MFLKTIKNFIFAVKSIQLYLVAFCILIALTFITINMYALKYNSIDFVLLIVSLKALIILLIFMGLWNDNKMYLLNVLLALFFIILLLFFCILDEKTRTCLSWEKENFLPRKNELFYKQFPQYLNNTFDKND